MTGDPPDPCSTREATPSAGDAIARFGRPIAGIVAVAVLGVALSCGGQKADKPAPAPAAVAPEPPVDDGEPRQLGTFDMTFYYVIGEEEVASRRAKRERASAHPHESGTELAAIAPVDTVTIYEGKSCEPIADVTREFLGQLQLQGTGKLRDGRVVNIFGACSCERSPCFKVTESRWGTGGTGKPLQPFRTVAVDRSIVKLGSLLYVPQLEGRTMPGRPPWGGFVHDGCLLADDTGGGIIGHQLDLFVGRKAYFYGLSKAGGSHAWARHIHVYDGSKICERKGRKVSRKAGAI